MTPNQYFSLLDTLALGIHQHTFEVTGQQPEWNDPVRLCRKCLQPFSSSKVRWRGSVSPCPFCHRPFPKTP